MATDWWFDLSGSELRARLVQRGVDPEEARHYVDLRERPEVARMITAIIGR